MKLHEYKSQNWWNKISYVFQSRNSVVLATFFNIFKTCCNFWSVQGIKILRIAKRSCDQARSISGFRTTKSSIKMAENDDWTFLAFFIHTNGQNRPGRPQIGQIWNSHLKNWTASHSKFKRPTSYLRPSTDRYRCPLDTLFSKNCNLGGWGHLRYVQLRSEFSTYYYSSWEFAGNFLTFEDVIGPQMRHLCVENFLGFL